MYKVILSMGLYGDYNKARKLAKQFKIFYPLYKLYESFHCAYLPLNNTLKGPVYFPHGVRGCFFSKECEIGEGCVIMHHVTIGSNYELGTDRSLDKYGAPKIGNNVFIGAGAKIIGPITIGDNAKIGAGCVVVKDVPAGATCVMQAPRLIIK